MSKLSWSILQTCAVSFLLSHYTLANYDTQNTILTQQTAPSVFSLSLEFSRHTITRFLKKVYNNDQYPQEYLALNFSHVTQGMSLAAQHPQPRRLTQKVLKLFSLKLHDIYVNPYALCTFLENLINQVSQYTDQEAEKAYIVELFKQEIGTCLSEQFDQLRYEPDIILGDLSKRLYVIAHESDDSSIRELQHTIHDFLSRALGLLTWSPDDQEDAWHIMMSITQLIEQSVQQNLIDLDMADDLYWTVLLQFNLFLSAAGPELAPSFFDTASRSLRTHSDAFWNTEERELYITTKANYLKNALMKAGVASQLHAVGYHMAAG